MKVAACVRADDPQSGVPRSWVARLRKSGDAGLRRPAQSHDVRRRLPRAPRGGRIRRRGPQHPSWRTSRSRRSSSCLSARILSERYPSLCGATSLGFLRAGPARTQPRWATYLIHDHGAFAAAAHALQPSVLLWPVREFAPWAHRELETCVEPIPVGPRPQKQRGGTGLSRANG